MATLGPVRTVIARYRIVVRVMLFVGLLLGGFWPVLEYRSNQLSAQLHELRERDPQAYLDTLRENHGYDRFMAAYRKVRGYDHWQSRPPYFAEGGWRLYRTRQDVTSDFTPALCHPALYLEPGQVHLRQDGRVTREALYRIRDGEIQVQMADGTVSHLKVIAPSQQIYYLRVTGLPSLDGPRYAYHCS